MPEMDDACYYPRFEKRMRSRHCWHFGAVSDGEVCDYDFDGAVRKPVRLEEFIKLAQDTLIGS